MDENIGGVGVVEGTAIADGAGDGGAAEADPNAGAGAGDGQGAEGQGDGAGDQGGAGGDGEVGADGAESEASEGDELGEIGEGEDDATLEGADGRRVDAKTRQDLAALKKVNPESAKRLGDMYHRTRSIMEEVGAQNLSEAVHKVRQLSATLEAVGGEDGLVGLQDEVGDYRNEIQQFANGDPELLTQLYDANAESFGKAILNGLDLLAAKDSKLFDNTIVGALVSRMESGGLYAAIDDIVKFVQDGKGQEAYDKLGQVKAWLNQAKQISDNQGRTRKEKDPRSEELDRREQALSQKTKEQFDGGVAEDVNRMNNRAMFKLVDPLMRELKIPTGGRREFVNALNSRVWAMQKKDKTFQRTANSLMDKGDRGKVANFVHRKFAELLPDAFRALRNELYPNYRPRVASRPAANGSGNRPANAQGKAAAAAPKAVPGKLYKRSEIDPNSPDELLITGRAYLKGSRTIVKYDQDSAR
jgi:hypothetical protein